MVFSSPIFLFLFLPLVLTLHLLIPGLRLRNFWLLLASIVFYAWGEAVFVFLILGSTLLNYLLGLWVDRQSATASRKWAVVIAITLNLGLLVFFKYANFIVNNLNSLLGGLKLGQISLDPIRLPIGISFFTFHALSYVVDIYRRKSRAARNPADVALYIFFFPQLIAGPILRWSAIAPQIARRVITREGFAEGVRRFILGLAKKMLIANTLAGPADKIFSLPAAGLSPVLAWTGALCYSLQIYFDFSGYSDMAIGLGRMFGFEFIENFNYPYISQSIKDFWRRWHISLSTWFRDYLYLPLGGNRCSTARTRFNLILVFFLCGLWHGASWTFVIWGLYHGLFLVLERTRFGSFLESVPQSLRHVYALVVVMTGWVLFRAESFPQALTFLGAMFGLGRATASQPLFRYLSNQTVWAILIGAILSAPAWPWLKKEFQRASQMLPDTLRPTLYAAIILIEPLFLITLLIFSAAWLAAGTYNPFILGFNCHDGKSNPIQKSP
jgi:alginate O-acetyltransferase complex protein AlgI